MTFDPATGIPKTEPEARAFWEFWGMKSWFHPDDPQDHHDDIPHLEEACSAAWELLNPWSDCMDEFWDKRSRAMYESMGMEVRE